MRRRSSGENPPTLRTDRLSLRALTPNDVEAVFAYASDPEATRYVAWETHRCIKDSRNFLNLALDAYKNGGEPAWGIVYEGDGCFIGTCGFAGWSPEHGRAEVGYVLRREYWGRGLASEAVRALLTFGFGRMGLNRIEARCIAENEASARVLEKAGMCCEGTLRQREFLKGAYRDIKLYAVLRGEYG